MGLDMYLEARRHIPLHEPQTVFSRRVLAAAIGYVPANEKPGQNQDLLEVSDVVVRVGYWRKLRTLHNWFVYHVQDGRDDCRPAFVDERCLGVLRALCERATKQSPATQSPSLGDLDGKELHYTLEILEHAIEMAAQGWDIYYRASW